MSKIKSSDQLMEQQFKTLKARKEMNLVNINNVFLQKAQQFKVIGSRLMTLVLVRPE